MKETSIKKAIEESMDKIKEIDDALIMGVVGVSQAMGELRKALDKLDSFLDKRNFQGASNLGYEDISSKFILAVRLFFS